MAYSNEVLIFHDQPGVLAEINKLVASKAHVKAIPDLPGYYACGFTTPSQGKWSPELVEGLKAVSAKSPSSGFALIWIECFGGPCDHWAKVFRAGKIEREYDEHPELEDILRDIGIKSDVPFQPFERGFFD